MRRAIRDMLAVLGAATASVVAAPVPVPATDGKVHLAYELQLTNVLDGDYAFHAHLKTGTVEVKPGDQLARGQVIANLGNTGNTDAPHLHFHVMSTPDPLHSNGLPFVFRNFTLDGRLASMEALDPLPTGAAAPMAPSVAPRDEAGVNPLVLDVMTYAEG